MAVGNAAVVTRAAIVSGVAPPEIPNRFKGMWPPVRMIFFTARYLPTINRMALKGMGNFYADKEQMLKRMKQALPAPDVVLIEARPEDPRPRRVRIAWLEREQMADQVAMAEELLGRTQQALAGGALETDDS